MNRQNFLSTTLLLLLALLISFTAQADFQYSKKHTFKVSLSLYDSPINQLTFPGSHNSFNMPGYDSNGCASTNPLLFANKNVDSPITQQINFGIRFLELDVYKSNGNWCVFHGSGGNSFLDGNSYYFSDVMDP